MDRCHLPEGPPRRPDRLRRRDHRRRCQQQRSPGGAGHGGRHLRGRADLDRVPTQADPPWPQRRQAGRLRRPRRPEGSGHQGSQRDMATLPGFISSAMCWRMPTRAAAGSSPPSPRRRRKPRAHNGALQRAIADQIRPEVPKLAVIMDDAEEDVLAHMTFPKDHRAKLHSTDKIDKSSPSKRGKLLMRGRPRGEAWCIG